MARSTLVHPHLSSTLLPPIGRHDETQPRAVRQPIHAVPPEFLVGRRSGTRVSITLFLLHRHCADACSFTDAVLPAFAATVSTHLLITRFGFDYDEQRRDTPQKIANVSSSSVPLTLTSDVPLSDKRRWNESQEVLSFGSDSARDPHLAASLAVVQEASELALKSDFAYRLTRSRWLDLELASVASYPALAVHCTSYPHCCEKVHSTLRSAAQRHTGLPSRCFARESLCSDCHLTSPRT